MEKSVFVTSTFIVGRERPPVPHLDGEPITLSYPSGHVAAAAVTYGALAVVVLWHSGRRAVRMAACVWCGFAVASVAVALYLGMHYLSDVVVGALLGAASLLLVVAIVAQAQRCPPARSRPRRWHLKLVPDPAFAAGGSDHP